MDQVESENEMSLKSFLDRRISRSQSDIGMRDRKFLLPFVVLLVRRVALLRRQSRPVGDPQERGSRDDFASG